MSRRSIMQVAVHTLGSVPSSAFKDSTPATPTNRGSPTAHRVRLFPSFLRFLFYCHATVCWSLLSYDAVPVVFFHFSVVAHVNFDAVFSQRYFLPSQKVDAQNAEMEMVSWLLLSFCSYFFKLYLYLLQNQKTIPPSQQPIASASVLPTSLCPICILAVGRSCRKSSTATCHS